MNKKEERRIIAEKTNGKCAYCGCNLPERWHVDHVKPVARNHEWDSAKRRFVYTGDMKYRDRDVIQNKLAACPSCNTFKSSFQIETFRHEIKLQAKRIRDKSTGFRISEKLGLIQENDIDVEFYFETLGVEV